MDDGSTTTPDVDPLDSVVTEAQNPPSSNSANNKNFSAPKDRECQYCHQSFTSSSLGRHLDQYIKPENPKKPDGIHDVEAIRQERGGITRRRKGRVSTDRHASIDTAAAAAAAATPSSLAMQESPRTMAGTPLNLIPREGLGTRINSLTWHSTGVIKETLDEQSQDHGASTVRSPSKRTAVKAEVLRRQESIADRDTARALELALREVLDNVRAANSRAQPTPSPFEFDLQSQSFPALCLLCLPAPPSLFSVQPFPTSFSWPLDPPGTAQLESVRQYLRSQVHQWRISHNRTIKRPSIPPKPIPQKENVDRMSREYEDMVTSHLAAAFKNWSSLNPTQQQETWHLEILRAFARESEKRKSVDAQLVRVQQEADHLRQQVETLSSCQNPREFTLLPPETMSITRSASRELHSSSGKFEDWDFDRLVQKWQGVVKSDRRNKTNLGAQRPLPAIDTQVNQRSVSTPGGLMANGHGHHGHGPGSGSASSASGLGTLSAYSQAYASHVQSSNESSPVIRRDTITATSNNNDTLNPTQARHFFAPCDKGILPAPVSSATRSGPGNLGNGAMRNGSLSGIVNNANNNNANGSVNGIIMEGKNNNGTMDTNMNTSTNTNEDAEGEDDSDAGYGQVLMNMRGGNMGGSSHQNQMARGGRLVEMRDAE